MIWKDKRGIVIKNNIVLDGNSKGGFTFISHAHADHLPTHPTTAVTTSITQQIANVRGRIIKVGNESDEDYELFDAGHVPGAKMLRLWVGDKTILYTGDFSLEGNGLVKGARVVPADILIVDATFSYPYFIFPSFKEVSKEIVDWVKEEKEKREIVYLFAYSFGKAQNLCDVLDKAGIEYRVDEEIYNINKILEGEGYVFGGRNIGSVENLSRIDIENMKKEGANVVIAPLRKRKMVNGNSIKAVASGWALSRGYAERMKVDKAFPLSDHADYEDILRFIDKVDPSLVLTIQTANKYFDNIVKEELGIYARILY